MCAPLSRSTTHLGQVAHILFLAAVNKVLVQLQQKRGPRPPEPEAERLWPTRGEQYPRLIAGVTPMSPPSPFQRPPTHSHQLPPHQLHSLHLHQACTAGGKNGSHTLPNHVTGNGRSTWHSRGGHHAQTQSTARNFLMFHTAAVHLIKIVHYYFWLGKTIKPGDTIQFIQGNKI